MVHIVSGKAASRIGQYLVRHPLSGRELHRVMSGCLTGCKYQLCCLDDITQLLPHMRFSCNVIYIRHQGRLGCNHLRHSCLTAGVRMAVIVGKHQSQITGIAGNPFMVPATHKYPVIGDKTVVKNGQALHITDLGKGSFQMGSLVVQPRKSHQLYAVPVPGKGKGHCIVRIVRPHKLGGIYNNFIHIGSIGVTDFGSPHNNPLTGFAVHPDSIHVCFHHMNKGIRVWLHVSSLVLGIAGAFHIGLGTVTYQVVFLAVFNIFQKSLMILCAAGLITVIGNGIQSVHGIGSHAALHTATYTMADQTGHQLLFQQILLAVVNVRTAIDRFSCDVRSGYTHICIIRVIGHIITLLHHIGAALNPVCQISLSPFLSVGAVHAFAVHIYIGFHFQKTFFILFVCTDCHNFLPSFSQWFLLLFLTFHPSWLLPWRQTWPAWLWGLPCGRCAHSGDIFHSLGARPDIWRSFLTPPNRNGS